MAWSPIEDLPPATDRLELPELRALDRLWAQQRSDLEQLDGMKRFRERLVRSWAIETGVVERVYDLDRGTTDLLIEKGIDASLIDRASTDRDPHLVAQIIGDQREAIEGIFNFVSRQRELSTSYIKELHATLMRSQATVEGVDQFGNRVQLELLRGEWKMLPNNPRRPDGSTHVYCPPPEHVLSEMDRLVERHLRHDADSVRPEVAAAWLHHRVAQIHPFQDGNGRVARALATLVFLRAGWFPLTVDRDRKPDYIEALEAADLGDLRYLSRMFGTLQRDELIRALGIGDQTVRAREGVEQVIRAARDDMLGHGTPSPDGELGEARSIAEALQQHGLERLREVKRSIDQQISDYRPEFSTSVELHPPSDERAQWYRAPVIRFARRHH